MSLKTNVGPENTPLAPKSEKGTECVQLIYISRAVGSASKIELPTILRRARGHNSEQGITGILCFAYGRYLQLLEGGAKEVNELYLKIGADKRHEAIRLMKFAKVQTRAFALWSMRLIQLDETSSEEARCLARFNNFGAFEPELWDGDECFAFLRTLSLLTPVHE